MKRILLKVSGEALGGNEGQGIDQETVHNLANQIKELQTMGVQIGMVCGGGNIFRGIQGESSGIDRVPADFMGMLATIINAVALQGIFDSQGIPSLVMTPFRLQEYVELYNAQKARQYLEEGKVVLLAGGAGHPFFTTDPAAALRAAELKVDLMIKATKVNGVYDSDPAKNPEARFFERLSYLEVLRNQLKVMDLSAVAMCLENKIPIRVLNVFEKNNIVAVCKGEQVGTLIHA